MQKFQKTTVVGLPFYVGEKESTNEEPVNTFTVYIALRKKPANISLKQR